MNWIFEAYSNVYNSAMMQNPSYGAHLKAVSTPAEHKPFSLRALLRRH